jgi:hypothetical protein
MYQVTRTINYNKMNTQKYKSLLRFLKMRLNLKNDNRKTQSASHLKLIIN